MIELILKVVLYLIDKLVQDAAERTRLKVEVIKETARYNQSVVDSVKIRKEYGRLVEELKSINKHQ